MILQPANSRIGGFSSNDMNSAVRTLRSSVLLRSNNADRKSLVAKGKQMLGTYLPQDLLRRFTDIQRLRNLDELFLAVALGLISQGDIEGFKNEETAIKLSFGLEENTNINLFIQKLKDKLGMEILETKSLSRCI